MNMIFVRESRAIKTSILRLAGEVERRLAEVLSATEQRDTDALKSWMARDSEIDDWEVLIEEECLKILALYQPVARDLRFVVAVLKINNDLERIGDIVVNIADRGLRLAAFPVTPATAPDADGEHCAGDAVVESGRLDGTGCGAGQGCDHARRRGRPAQCGGH